MKPQVHRPPVMVLAAFVAVSGTLVVGQALVHAGLSRGGLLALIWGIVSVPLALLLFGLAVRPPRTDDAPQRPPPGTRPEATVRADIESVLSAMKEGLLIVDAYERIVLANDEAARIVGAGAPDLQNKYLWDVVADPALQEICRRALRSPKAMSLESTALVGGRHIEATASAVPGQGAALLLLDVSELHRLERVRRDFVANVSHELRTPLAAIVAFVETLRTGALQDAENAPKFLATIDKHAHAMTALVRDLLELARLESGKAGLERVPVDPAEVSRSAAAHYADAARQRGVELKLELSENLPSVSADALLLERAVSNLIDNAIKYTSQGTVRIRGELRGDRVALLVQDTGVGIAPEEQERIFERFYRVDKSHSRAVDGVGLGLSIVKHVAEAHGGEVRVESSAGHGSTFTLLLPRVRD